MKAVALFLLIGFFYSASGQTFTLDELLKIHRSNYDSVSAALKQNDWWFAGRKDTKPAWALFEWQDRKMDANEHMLINYAQMKQLLYATKDRQFFDSSLQQLKTIFKDYTETKTETHKVYFFDNGRLMKITASHENRRNPRWFNITFTSIFQEESKW
jgi:hypothetical protein